MTLTRNTILTLLGCSCLVCWGDNAPLQIAQQGVFSSGGTVTPPVSGAYDSAKNWTDLPRLGITGNSHFMFQETNNAAIAAHLEKWLTAHGL